MKISQGFRWFYTSSDKLVLAGKNAEQNEQIVKQAKVENIVLHTKEPGSPFCIIHGDISEKDIKETAVFCACFSQGWKKRKKEMEVHIFKGAQIVKADEMKTGTFGVLGKVKSMKVPLELWIGMQKGKLRAVPKSCLENPLIKITPGKIEKGKAAEIIRKMLEEKFNLDKNAEEIEQAIPAGGFRCW